MILVTVERRETLRILLEARESALAQLGEVVACSWGSPEGGPLSCGVPSPDTGLVLSWGSPKRRASVNGESLVLGTGRFLADGSLRRRAAAVVLGLAGRRASDDERSSLRSEPLAGAWLA